MRLDHIFLFSFLCSLVIQGTYWKTFGVVDQSSWITATQSLMTLAPGMFNPFTYGYPGTPPMMLAIGVYGLFNVPFPYAYTGSLAVIISLATATSAVFCKLLRPHLLWWLGCMVTLSSHTLYREATPPSVVVIPFVTLLLLVSFYIYENRPVRRRWPFIMLGIVTGLAAAARLDVAVFIALLQALLLWPTIGASAVLLTVLVALGAFFIANPFMWFFPVHHLTSFLNKLSYHYTDRSVQLFRVGSFLEKSFFAWLGMVYGGVFFLVPKLHRAVPRWITLNLFIVTSLLAAVLLSAAYRPSWYFFPLIILWEVFFLLFVLELVSRLQRPIAGIQFFVVTLFILVRLGLLLLLIRFPAFFIA